MDPTYPSRGALKDIPTRPVLISTLTNMRRAERQRLLEEDAEILWVLDVEPTYGPDAGKPIKHVPFRRKPIFKERPKIMDVEQFGLGDCWFLAAITSILAFPGGPEYIESMISDDERGDWVTVRLFDRCPKQPTGADYRPRFIQVRRTLVHTGWMGNPLRSAAADGEWVCMLEKAATTFNRSLSSDPGDFDYYASFQPQQANYRHLVGGNCDKAFELFFGLHFKRESLGAESAASAWVSNRNIPDEYTYLTLLFTMMQDPETQVDNVQGWLDVPPISERAIPLRPILNKAGFDKFAEEALPLIQDRYENFVDARTKHRLKEGNEDIEVNASMRLEDFIHYILYETGLRNIAVKKSIIDWVTARGMFPRKRGTGKYARRQEVIFDNIRNHLANGPVCMATNKYVGRSSSGRGHSGGESKTKGLAGMHAYGVLNTVKAEDEAYLLVSNPWRSYGRIYVQNVEKKPGASAKADKEQFMFWLDLFDFTKRGDRIYYIDAASIPALREKINDVATIKNTGVKTYLTTYPTVGTLPAPHRGGPYADHNEYSYHIANTFLCRQNLNLLKNKFVSSGEPAIAAQGISYMAEVMVFCQNFNVKSRENRVNRWEENRIDLKGNKEQNYYLIRDADVETMYPRLGTPLQLKEWKEASALSTTFALRKRIVPVDKAVEEYVKECARAEMNITTRFANLFDCLGVIFEKTRSYLERYPDSGRRMGTRALEYLVILEIVRLLELLHLMKIDVPLAPARNSAGEGIRFLCGLDKDILSRGNVPTLINKLYMNMRRY